MNDKKVNEVTSIIGRKFRSFGGGQSGYNNPMAVALKDRPLQFAAGVDIKSVVETVLVESGHDVLLDACKEIVSFCESKERVAEDGACPVKAYQLSKDAIAQAEK